MPVGVSTDVSAQALPVTEFIHGEPEPVVVGPLQPLPFLTVNELVPLDQSMPPDSSFLCLPSNDDASPILPPFAENLGKTLLFNPSLNLATRTDSHCCSNDVASAASSHQAPAGICALNVLTMGISASRLNGLSARLESLLTPLPLQMLRIFSQIISRFKHLQKSGRNLASILIFF